MTSLRVRSAWGLLAAAVGAAAGLLSCGTNGRNFQTNSCTTNAQCSSGLVCDPMQQICVSPVPNTVQVVLVAVPPNNTPSMYAATTVQAAGLISGNNATVNVSLHAPCLVYGTVEVPSAAGSAAQPIGATVRFHLAGGTPAQTDVSAPVSSTVNAMMDGRPFAYQTSLPPGTYDVTVQPADGSTYPPFFIHGQTIACDTDPHVPLSIVYATPTQITGRVVDQSSSLPVPGVRVQIVDPLQNNLVISSVVQTAFTPTATNPTAPPAGSFTLALASGATERWALQVISTPTQPTPGTASGRFVFQTDRAHLGANDNYVNLSVLAPPTVGLAGSVTGTCDACVGVQASVQSVEPDGSRVDLAGAVVDLHASDVVVNAAGGSALAPGALAWLDAQATTAADGTFQAALVPGHYAATITPAQGSGFAISAATLTVTRRLVGPILSVQPLVPVSGRVLNGAQEAMPGMAGVTIEAIPIPVAPSDPTALPVRQSQAVTNANGQYTLPLDAGQYAFVIHPPDESGFATQIVQPVIVAAGVPLALPSVSIAAPFAVTGVVNDSRGMPLAGASVRAYVRYPSAGGDPFDVEVGRATAGAMGQYSLLMSSRLMSAPAP